MNFQAFLILFCGILESEIFGRSFVFGVCEFKLIF
jgi:hypothetical protein